MKNVIAIFMVFALLMSFAACRRLDESGAFVVEVDGKSVVKR